MEWEARERAEWRERQEFNRMAMKTTVLTSVLAIIAPVVAIVFLAVILFYVAKKFAPKFFRKNQSHPNKIET